jgi:DNA sulfur modification protein DndB
MGKEVDGHPFMRPVVQVTVARAVRHLIEQKLLTWDEALERLSQLDWRLGAPLFLSVFVEAKGTMAAGKQFTELLYKLLLVHLAPRNKAEIHRALVEFKQLKNAKKYPVTEDELAARVIAPPPE